MICGIYGIHNLITDKWYVGQSQDIEKRWNQHLWGLRHGTGESIHLLRAWEKYGETSFEWVILEECELNKLDEKEIEWIKAKNSFRKGYNRTEGGGGSRGYQQSDETRTKKSQSLKIAMNTTEYRELRSQLSKNMWEKSEYRSKVLSIRAKSMNTPEYKEKISMTTKARNRNPEYKNNYKKKCKYISTIQLTKKKS